MASDFETDPAINDKVTELGAELGRVIADAIQESLGKLAKAIVEKFNAEQLKKQDEVTSDCPAN